MNIIIVADKYQKRMKSKGCVGLIKYLNKNILSHQYQILQNIFPKSNIVYIYGFDNKRLINYIDKKKQKQEYKYLQLIYNSQYDTYNNAYSLYLAKNFLNDDCIIFFGDNIIKSSTFKDFKITQESQVFIDNNSKNKIGCIINNNRIYNISYDLDNILSEIYFISKPQITLFKSLVSNNHNYFIFEIINKMIDLNQNFSPFINKHRISL
jgi:choline kinase